VDLYWKLVNAGYINSGHKEVIHSITGVPQGGIISPLLSNIYLHEFDLFMENIKKEYTEKGVVSKMSPKYAKILGEERKARNKLKTLLKNKSVGITEIGKAAYTEALLQAKSTLRRYTAQKRSTPSRIRIRTRVYYVRYADD